MEEEKIKLMRRIAKEGHSFPHYDTCATCEEDFDEVYQLGEKNGNQDLWEKLWKIISLDSVGNLMTMDMSKARILLENEGVEVV